MDSWATNSPCPYQANVAPIPAAFGRFETSALFNLKKKAHSQSRSIYNLAIKVHVGPLADPTKTDSIMFGFQSRPRDFPQGVGRVGFA